MSSEVYDELFSFFDVKLISQFNLTLSLQAASSLFEIIPTTFVSSANAMIVFEGCVGMRSDRGNRGGDSARSRC